MAPHYYQSIYTSLRAAMIDRDMGDKEEDAVLVDFVSAQIALKPALPSAAVLISYSMLFYPNWLNGANPEVGLVPVGKTIETFVGGVENHKFPILFNIHMAMIATAIGVYTGLLRIHYSSVLQTIMINPNMENPLVMKTYELIKDNPELTYTNARDIFIELMQQEEYAAGIILADDFVANASFIEEASASVGEDSAEYMKQVENMNIDLSKEFRGSN